MSTCFVCVTVVSRTPLARWNICDFEVEPEFKFEPDSPSFPILAVELGEV